MKRKLREKRSPFFYTEEQVQELTTAMNSGEFKSDNAVAKFYAEKFNRNRNSLFNKICSLRGKNVRGEVKPKIKVIKEKAIKVKKTPVAKIEVKPLTLPEGMTYQGKAKKVELHADHFRVYF